MTGGSLLVLLRKGFHGGFDRVSSSVASFSSGLKDTLEAGLVGCRCNWSWWF